jgi:predicted nuclease of restriction endonuclease-like (RecB) superfamily
VARQSSAKASTAVRIRSRPLKTKSLQFGGFFYALILWIKIIELYSKKLKFFKMSLSTNTEYKNWLIELKANIKRSQIKAALAVNSELIRLYWDLGKQIVEKQEHAQWGSGFIDQLSKDLKADFPDVGGFSAYNLRMCKTFYLFHNESSSIWEQLVPKLKDADNQLVTKSEQVVGFLETNLFNIPWGHHVLILKKIKEEKQALFYINQTIENNWSRAVLEMHIETNLYARQGKAITNFKTTLPEIDSDLAQDLLKDIYNFEFISFSGKVKELKLEQKLIDNITKFLLELGKGFAYMGRQFEINVGGEIFKTDCSGDPVAFLSYQTQMLYRD